MDFPKKQAQRLMPLYLLEYSEKLFENHPDPEAPWGGGDYTAGYGIDITNDEISVDTTVVATKSDISSMVTTTMLEDALDDYALKTDIPENVSDLNNDAGYTTQTWVENQGYLTSSDLSNYVTSSELSNQLSNYALSSTVTNLASQVTTLESLVSANTSNISALQSSVSNCVTLSQLSSTLSYYTPTSGLASVATTGDYNDLINKPNLVNPHTLASGDLVFQSTGTWYPSYKWFDDEIVTSASSSFVDIITDFESDLILTSEFTRDGVLYAKRMVDGFQVNEHEFRYVYALYSVNGEPGYIWFIYNDSLDTITSVTKQTAYSGIYYPILSNIFVTSSSLSSTLSNYAQVSTLASVATTGNYNDLLSKPTIPSSATTTVSASSETLTFTYSDNTTVSFTFLTAITSATTTLS